MTDERIEQWLTGMTLEEKASLCSGADLWHTKGVARLNIPSIMMTDGPHGLRISPEPGQQAVRSTCFPSGAGLASSWNPDLLKIMGAAIADECQAEGVQIILGPAVNIKRSPLCGRNFEYYSEDPCLASKMAAGHINGVQFRGVGTSIKHFALNNQETDRLVSDSVCDQRAIREIYLAAFEEAIREAKPWTVMCAYNRINGVYASDNKWLLTDVLRKDWGFDGTVMTDWGALNDRIKSIQAGLELEMPGSGGVNDRKLVEAVRSGKLDESILDEACRRILTLVDKAARNIRPDASYNKDSHHQLARRIAGESMVLLKNEGNLLPLDANAKVAVIGAFAVKPRFQGGGSSHIQETRLDIPYDELTKEFGDITYCPGYDLDSDESDTTLLEEACQNAIKADVAVIFAGLPDRYESEGYDRDHMRIPENQLFLINTVARVQPNLVVVLMNGSPVEMPWADRVKGILEAYLGGQGAGGAIADILSGAINPSGKLAETFPLKLNHNPSYLNFPGENKATRYAEGVFVGYRYYDRKQIDVLFPFGHGLSYTRFTYSDLRLSKNRIRDDETLEVSLKIANTGDRGGSEIVQLYVSPPASMVLRPVKELRAFKKIWLEPGEEKHVTLSLGRRAFAYWHESAGGWFVESGAYRILAGASSRDILLMEDVEVDSCDRFKMPVDRNTSLGELMDMPETAAAAGKILEQMIANNPFGGMDEANLGIQDFLAVILKSMPLRSLVMFSQGRFSEAMMEDIIASCNR